jgi:peptide/nickel transport system permease protein
MVCASGIDMAAVLPASELGRPVKPSSPWRRAMRKLVQRRPAIAGLVIVAAFIALALFAPWITSHDPVATSWSAIRKAPNAVHWFGTDEIGRDVLSRVVWGTRASLLAGVVSVSISLLLGVPIGLIAGFVGGVVDGFISRVTDAFLACPFLILAIALAAFLGPSLTNAMIAIGIAALPTFLRLARGTAMAITTEDFVESARSLGCSRLRIAVRHVLPNMVPPLLIQSSLTVAAAIIAEASLSFLGLGQQPPAPSWGSMLNAAQRYLVQAPWMAIYPGLMIFAIVMSLNVLGDALRDALDPRYQ